MRQDLSPSKCAIGKSRQEGHGVSEISLSPQEHVEGCALRSNDGACFEVVADALTTREPSFGGRRPAAFAGGCGRHRCKLHRIGPDHFSIPLISFRLLTLDVYTSFMDTKNYAAIAASVTRE